MVRKSKGRQKIEMVKMKNESNLQVTFSKRRSGLFKKASELCTLCNAEIAIVVFSPGQKVYSFGHPNVEIVVDRFLNINPLPHHQYNNMQLQHNEAHQSSIVQHLNDHLTKVVNQLEAEKKKNENLKQIRKNNKRSENWWEKPLEELNLNQVLQLKTTLENLKNKVRIEASKLLQTTVVPHQNFYAAGSSSNGCFRNSGDLELFNQRRMMNTNTNANVNANTNANAFSYNHNMIVPNHHQGIAFGNKSDGNLGEDFAQDYNMRYRLEYEQEQNQNQGFKKEHISEYEQHPQLPYGHGFY